jgi:hypothetical protein
MERNRYYTERKSRISSSSLKLNEGHYVAFENDISTDIFWEHNSYFDTRNIENGLGK